MENQLETIIIEVEYRNPMKGPDRPTFPQVGGGAEMHFRANIGA